ncbi:uncharacterized protein F5891DRAFT_1128385 [Suillus fuscotomentosus]|uniref:Uncharacterized protein n=1 Tax=Suillus fuscotomentosus TaxID=1912939 RepID=A0AAD4HKC3_9AGAM|nr:uncharacterized protein F5891DRAFT_1128385 [Suillus fuscotomentosus]KAG1900840.1 hypothetical protein F5891DRAFT_1128385 [Suillus fuscotomentosus]
MFLTPQRIYVPICLMIQDLYSGCSQRLIPPPLAFPRFHPTSGYIYDLGQPNTFERMKQDDFKDMREHNVYYPFSDRAEWELAKFLCENLNQGQITRFLKLLWVGSEARQPLSFKNAKQIFTFMEALLVTPKWKCAPIETDGYTTTHPVNLIWRDALEVAHHIFGNPIFANHMEYDPYEIQDNGEREYGEWMSCEHAFEIQAVPIILASDKTPMHPTFLTIRNIHSEIRMKATTHAWACITYILTPEYIVNHDFSGVLEVCLWHRCMDMVLQNLKVAAQVGEFMTDPMGCRHYTFTPLIAHITDLPEQLMIAYPWKVREFLEQAKQRSLSGIQLPYWRDWRFADPAIFLIPELLHMCHKFFFDHVLKWCKEVIGANELDARFRSQHKHIGMRHFADGISHVNQMTGREHRDIQRRLVPTIVGVTSPGFVRAVRALVDFIYKAQAPTFTNSSIGSMVASLNEFHAHKHFILEAEAHTGASGPIGHFQIPKLELFNSFARSIRKSGAIIQHSADASERLHQRGTFTQQVVNVVNREDMMRQFDLYTLLREQGISLVNIMDEEFNEVVDTDPTFSRIACITPQEMHPFHVTIALDLADKTAITLANQYHLPHFQQMLAQFLEAVAGPNSHFRGRLLKVCNIMPSQQVQAYPPSPSYPYGNCDIVLLQPPGLDPQYPPYIAQVQMVFTLSPRGSQLPAELMGPFLYVELFEIAAPPEAEPHIAMYRVRRSFYTAPDGSRMRVGRIVCLIDVTHAVELIPVYGVTLDCTVTSTTSLELYNDFYLNAFSDKEWYHMLHADYV